MSAATPMQAAVERYLEGRRRLGFAMTAPATELARFARYADAQQHRGPLTQELMLGWAREHVHRTSDVTAARRLEIVLYALGACEPAEPAESQSAYLAQLAAFLEDALGG